MTMHCCVYVIVCFLPKSSVYPFAYVSICLYLSLDLPVCIVGVYVYIYIHAFLCVHTYLHTYIHIYIGTYMCTYINTHTGIYIETYIFFISIGSLFITIEICSIVLNKREYGNVDNQYICTSIMSHENYYFLQPESNTLSSLVSVFDIIFFFLKSQISPLF